MIAHRSPISGIATHGGQLVLTAGYDNQVILWDAGTKQALARGVHDHLANQCSFNADGSLAASSSSDYSARIWELPTLRLAAVLNGHDDDVEGIVFHPSKPWIATSSRDGRVRVFDTHGNLLHRLEGHAADVISVTWLGDGPELISSSDDGTVRRWNAEKGLLLETLEFDGVETDTIAVSGGGAIIAGNDEGRLIVVENGGRFVHDAHEAGVKRVIHDDETGLVVSLSYDRTAKFWKLGRGGELILLESTHLPPVIWPRSCAFLDAQRVAFVTFGSTYAVYDLSTGSWDLHGVGETQGVNGACFRSGQLYTVGDSGVVKADGRPIAEMGSLCNFIVRFGSRLLTGGQMGRIMDAETGEVYFQHRSPLNCAVAAGEGTASPRLLVGSYTGEAVVLELAEGSPRFRELLPLHDNAIKGLASSGNLLFSVCATGAAAVHDAWSGEPLHVLQSAHEKIANGCSALPDGRFVSVSRDLKVRIWSGGDATVHPTPHRNSIKCCAASADGRLVATGDYAGTIGILDVESGLYVRTYRATDAGISSMIPGPEADSFIATSYDGAVHDVALSGCVSRGRR